MLATLLLAAEEAEPSKTPFYIVAGCLIVWALILAFGGMARHETFPPSRGVATGLMLVTALLVAGTMFTAVYTA
jgi:drug/metabolite transporter (DMT)-like permease